MHYNTMNLENISDVKQTSHKRINIVGFHLHEVLRIVKFIETESRLVGTRGGGRGQGMGSSCLMGTEFLLDMMKSSRNGTGDGYITTYMYLMPWNSTLKNGESGKFYVMCVLPQ